DAGPVGLGEPAMGLGESADARIERASRLFGIVSPGKGLMRNRDDRRERILDAMAELGDEQIALFLGPLPIGDVAGNLGGADDSATEVPHRRYGEGDIDQAAILPAADGLVVVDALAAAKAGKNLGLLVLTIPGDDDGDGSPDHLVGGIAEQALGA